MWILPYRSSALLFIHSLDCLMLLYPFDSLLFNTLRRCSSCNLVTPLLILFALILYCVVFVYTPDDCRGSSSPSLVPPLWHRLLHIDLLSFIPDDRIPLRGSLPSLVHPPLTSFASHWSPLLYPRWSHPSKGFTPLSCTPPSDIVCFTLISFPFSQMIASLSQGFTLKPGDVLLTGK